MYPDKIAHNVKLRNRTFNRVTLFVREYNRLRSIGEDYEAMLVFDKFRAAVEIGKSQNVFLQGEIRILYDELKPLPEGVDIEKVEDRPSHT